MPAVRRVTWKRLHVINGQQYAFTTPGGFAGTLKGLKGYWNGLSECCVELRGLGTAFRRYYSQLRHVGGLSGAQQQREWNRMSKNTRKV